MNSPDRTTDTAPRYSFSVLIVDDNIDITKSLGRLLELRGHFVRIAYTGHDAIAQATAWIPDAILLDIGLPDISGYAVAVELRKRKLPCSLIALTGYGQEEDKLRAKNAGFDRHITKPASFMDIEQALLEVCR